MHSMQSWFGAPCTTPAAVVTVILAGFGLLSTAGKAQEPPGPLRHFRGDVAPRVARRPSSR